MFRNGPRAIVAWLPVLAWMLAIFAGSTDILSGQHTAQLLRPFLHWFKPDLSEDAVQSIQWMLRKMGHLTEFAVLAEQIALIERTFDQRSRRSVLTASSTKYRPLPCGATARPNRAPLPGGDPDRSRNRWNT